MKEICEEKQIKSTNITKSAWIYLIRQIFICSGVASYFFLQGLFFGAPTVYIPQIRKEANSTDIIGMEMVSWLYSISSYGSLIWSIMIPLIAEGFGRKVPFIIAWVNTMVCVLLFYCSTSVTELLVSALLLGILPSVLIAMSIMILTEYTSPRYRGVLITFKGATFYWGIWVSNAIGTFFHWKNIGILIFICCIYNISILFWPESPFWLASKGNFVECAKWHRWLKGEDKDSEEELMQLLTLQKELKRKQEGQKNKLKVRIVKQYNIMKAKRFYKPFIFAILTICLYHFSGKMACAGYVLDIIKTITVSESTAYEGMLVLDGVTVFGMYIGVCLNKFLKRRTLFLGSSTIGVTFLFILSLYLYLVHLNVVAEKKYLTLFLLTGFSVSISCGPMIMSMCFCSELTPLKGRILFLCLFTLFSNILMGSTLKSFPYILKYFDSYGTFLFFALMSSMFICILYKVLPETKDRTIQDIEKSFIDDNVLKKYDVPLKNLEAACDINLLSLRR
ncbi:galactose-proton symporter-like [Maniola hyperantus]|uniref:galactose-proton symporter-like n=1 Tax=Aphantopus hyperantus TaxID=2795564 RepID=UPI002137D538